MEEKAQSLKDFLKFPRTRHLCDMGGSIGRDDLVMDKTEVKKFLENDIIIEEKVDGSNLGISLTEDYQLTFQNRSHYVTVQSAEQWKNLELWMKQHSGIYNFLSPELILFGEWMYQQHSIHYTKLSDTFLVFDIFNKKESKFLSVDARNEMLEGSGLSSVPLIGRGKYELSDLQTLLSKESAFYEGPLEGVYLRIDGDEFLRERAKIVRSDFLLEDEEGTVVHYSKKKLVRNIVSYE